MLLPALIAIFVAGHQTDPYAAKVDFLERGAPLARVMPRLAAATNLHLSVAPATKNEVVCIDVHDVTVKELMDRLAHVTACTWEPTKDGAIRLTPSPSARVAERAREVDSRAQMIAKLLQPAKVKPKKKSDDDGEDQSDFPPPVAGLLNEIGVQTLASIPNDTRTVFSTRPTPTQVPLDASAINICTGLLAEQAAGTNKFLDEIWKRDLSDEDREMAQRFREELKIGEVTKVLLIVERSEQQGQSGNLHLQMVGYDSKGHAARPNLPELWWSEPPTEEVSNTPITLSPETTQLARLRLVLGLASSDRPKNILPSMPRQARDAALKLALEPDKLDPLAYGDDMLLGLAKAKRCQLVACIPEGLTYLQHQSEHGAPTPTAILALLRNDCLLETEVRDGWLSAMPRDSTASEASRVDRGLLARLMKELRSDRYERLDRLMEMASDGIDFDAVGSVGSEWPMLAADWVLQVASQDWQTVRLCNSMSDLQRLRLSRMHQLSLSMLTEDQLAIVRHMIYGPHYGNTYTGLDVTEPQTNLFPSGNLYYGQEDYRTEPTEIAPNGLPPNGTMTLIEGDDTMILADQGDTTRFQAPYRYPMSPAMLANRAARTIVPSWSGRATPFKTDLLYVGSRHMMTFEIHVASDVQRSGILIGYTFPADAAPLTLATLPDDMKKAINKAVDRLKKIPPPSQGNGSPP